MSHARRVYPIFMTSCVHPPCPLFCVLWAAKTGLTNRAHSFLFVLRTSYAGQANPPLRASLLAREMLCFDAFPRLHASRSHLHSLSLPLYLKYPTRTLHARPSLLARSSSHRYRLLLKVQLRRDRTRSRALLALDITALLVVMASERCFTFAVAEHDSSIAMMLHVNEAWWVHTGPTEGKECK